MRGRQGFFNPNFHERCPQGHIYSKELAQCPICYAPKIEDECDNCGHPKEGHFKMQGGCLWTGCMCGKFEQETNQRN